MNKQKKNKGALKGFLGRRQFRYGGYATVLTAIVIAIVILLNVAISAIENNWSLSIDVTSINVTDLSEDTDKVLAGITDEVHVYTLYQDSTNTSLRIQVEAVLNEYHARNNKLVVSNIDPVKEPARVKAYTEEESTLSEGTLIVTNADESRVKVIPLSAYYGTETDSYFRMSYTYFDLERKMTGALIYVTSSETPRVFYLSGHDELDADNYMTVLTAQLEGQNYDVAKLNLTSTEIALQPGDTVVVVNPKRDLSDAEYEILRPWLSAGGRMLFVLDYNTDINVLNNFTKLLSYYQLSFGNGIIKEDASETANWNQDYYMLVPNMNAEHAVTKDMAAAGTYMMLPQSRPINPVDMPESGYQFTKLLTTSNKAVVMEGDEAGMPGTQTIAMSMLKEHETDDAKDIRIAVLGNIYALADTNLLYYSYNLDFTVSLFNWLVNRQEATVDISAKMMADTILRIPDSTTAWVLAGTVVAAIPLLVLIGGIVVWRRRRSL